MKNILTLANDISLLSEMRTRCSDLSMINNFTIIDTVLGLSVERNLNIDMDVINIANQISNLEPTVSLSNGYVLTLTEIRERDKYEKSEITFVIETLTPLLKPLIKTSNKKIQRAITHLLLGCEVINDVQKYKHILLSSLIYDASEARLAILCGYAKKLKCNSVRELSNLFAFYYPDRIEDILLKKPLISYQSKGKTFSVSVRY